MFWYIKRPSVHMGIIRGMGQAPLPAINFRASPSFPRTSIIVVVASDHIYIYKDLIINTIPMIFTFNKLVF